MNDVHPAAFFSNGVTPLLRPRRPYRRWLSMSPWRKEGHCWDLPPLLQDPERGRHYSSIKVSSLTIDLAARRPSTWSSLCCRCRRSTRRTTTATTRQSSPWPPPLMIAIIDRFTGPPLPWQTTWRESRIILLTISIEETPTCSLANIIPQDLPPSFLSELPMRR